jgi:CheY-like chemotaxis protein
MQRLATASLTTQHAAAAIVEPPVAPALQTLHVLIADANSRTLATRVDQLRAAGLRVSIARTSFEAIVKATCSVPDLILLDGSLGEIDAAETGRMLTVCPVTSHIPVYRLTPGRRVPQRVLAATRRLPS